MAADAPSTAPAYPLWDGHEAIADYARRVNLSPTKTLDLGGGVNLDLVLIPAGKFVMGTPEPKPVDEVAFRNKIVVGQAVFGIGAGVLLVLIGGILVRAIRQRRRPQFSLACFVVMTLVAGVGVLGGMHWWHSAREFSKATAEYQAALTRFKDSGDWEKPAHDVTLTTPFYMGKFAVTQEQYEQVQGSNPSRFKGKNNPVETVSWNDAQEFIKKGGEKTRQTLRLPTDAEREFACRAGTTTTYYTGDAEADLGRAAWYGTNSRGKTYPVGQKEPNAFGLYDMHGNVWEWCADGYEAYKSGAVVDPQGASESCRVLRGGSWYFNNPGFCRSAYRRRFDPGLRFNLIGFRVVLASGTP